MVNKILTLGILLGLIVFMVILLRSPASKMQSPAMITQQKLATLKTAVLEYAKNNQKLPTKLTDLNLPEQATLDPGGVPFVYQIDGNKVTILSYGSDGKPGGHTFSADQKTVFRWPE